MCIAPLRRNHRAFSGVPARRSTGRVMPRVTRSYFSRCLCTLNLRGHRVDRNPRRTRTMRRRLLWVGCLFEKANTVLRVERLVRQFVSDRIECSPPASPAGAIDDAERLVGRTGFEPVPIGLKGRCADRYTSDLWNTACASTGRYPFSWTFDTRLPALAGDEIASSAWSRGAGPVLRASFTFPLALQRCAHPSRTRTTTLPLAPNGLSVLSGP